MIYDPSVKNLLARDINDLAKRHDASVLKTLKPGQKAESERM